jgi:hypothetical protein
VSRSLSSFVFGGICSALLLIGVSAWRSRRPSQ